MLFSLVIVVKAASPMTALAHRVLHYLTFGDRPTSTSRISTTMDMDDSKLSTESGVSSDKENSFLNSLGSAGDIDPHLLIPTSSMPTSPDPFRPRRSGGPSATSTPMPSTSSVGIGTRSSRRGMNSNSTVNVSCTSSKSSSSSQTQSEMPRAQRSARGRSRSADSHSSGSSETSQSSRNSTDSHRQSDIQVLHGYKNLIKDMHSLEKEIKPTTLTVHAKTTNKLIETADDLASSAYSSTQTSVVNYDGNFMESAGRVVTKLTESLEVNARTFNTAVFIEAIRNFFSRYDGNASQFHRLTVSEWAQFGREEGCPISRRSALFDYMYGAYDFRPPEGARGSTQPPEEQQPGTSSDGQRPLPKKRARLNIAENSEAPDVITDAATAIDKDQTVEEVEEMFKKMQVLYKKNKKRPFPYLTAVVDPSSFGKTVENIFHFSFLKKEGVVKIVKVGGTSSVIPIQMEEQQKAAKRRQTEKQDEDRCQTIFTVSQSMFPEWVEKVKMRRYQIPTPDTDDDS